jgi:hypothetical protein
MSIHLSLSLYTHTVTLSALLDCSLTDVVQSEGRLYLVFEFVDKDLKKYFEHVDGPLQSSQVQVRAGCEYIYL